MNKRILRIAGLIIAGASPIFSQTVWLDELDLTSMEAGWGTPNSKRSVEGHGLSVGGQKFDRGVGTHAVSTYLLSLDGRAKTFSASVGVDDEVDTGKASVEFFALGDRKLLWRSGVMRWKDPSKKFDLDVTGVKLLGLLVTDAGDGIGWDHADWCDARLELTGNVLPSDLAPMRKSEPYVLTPKPAGKPRINGAKVFGVRPGNPFLYTIAASGNRPMTFEARNLPTGLRLDPSTGRITGRIVNPAEYTTTLVAINNLGRAAREFQIVVGNRICLTPPMGWNSWNCWACAVDDAKVRSSADAMVSSGLVDHGWTYINIDDCWEVKPDAKDSALAGDPRGKDGMINTNRKFPDMKALAGYVHGRGLKLGIYSGPGPVTCQGFTASYRFEEQDARSYAEWGIDYLKYDWCSYSQIAGDRSLPALRKPYELMRAALDKVPRDIVYSLCQYGMGNVWEWGNDVGGNCWRTTGDITDAWSSVSQIGFGQDGHEKFAGPGHWNDPDMLVVGLVGWGPELHLSRLTPDEQYTHISLWSLLAAPLLIGCDLGRLDEFSLNLLTNDEVIDINQDPLGAQARRIYRQDGNQVWVKDLEDGAKAVGLFYVDDRDRKDPADWFSWDARKKATIAFNSSDAGIAGRMRVRDVWRQTDLGVFDRRFETEVPYHGVVLLKVTPEK